MMRAQSQNTGDTVSKVVESPEKKKVPKLCLKRGERGLKSRHYKEFPKKTLARHSPQNSSANFRATSRITASLGYSGSSTKFDRSSARGKTSPSEAAQPAPPRYLMFREVGRSATAAHALPRHPSWVQSFTKRFIGISFRRFSKNAKKVRAYWKSIATGGPRSYFR
jgi:hypothetical protein